MTGKPSGPAIGRLAGSRTATKWLCFGYGFRFVNGRACSISASVIVADRLHAHHLPPLYNVLCHRSGYFGRGRPYRALFPVQGSLAGKAGGCDRARAPAPAMAAASAQAGADDAAAEWEALAARRRAAAKPLSSTAPRFRPTGPSDGLGRRHRLAVDRPGRRTMTWRPRGRSGCPGSANCSAGRRRLAAPRKSVRQSCHCLRRDGRAGAGADDLARRRGAAAAANRRRSTGWSASR